MDPLIEYCVAQFERIFPAQAGHSPVIRQALITRGAKIQTILAFYLEKKDAELAKGKIAELNDMCLRATRAAILAEIGRNTSNSSFMLRTFVSLNKPLFEDMLAAALQSLEVENLISVYPFTGPLVGEVSNPEWLSSLLGQ